MDKKIKEQIKILSDLIFQYKTSKPGKAKIVLLNSIEQQRLFINELLRSAIQEELLQ